MPRHSSNRPRFGWIRAYQYCDKIFPASPTSELATMHYCNSSELQVHTHAFIAVNVGLKHIVTTDSV